jgi:hypothetical protein
MEELGGRLLLLSITLFIPAALLLASFVLGFNTVLLTIIVFTWIGVSIVLLSPFMA